MIRFRGGGDWRCPGPIRLICVSGFRLRRGWPFAPRRRGAFQGVGFLRGEPDESGSRPGKLRSQAERRPTPRQARTASVVSFGAGRREGRHHHAGTGGRARRRDRRDGRSRFAVALAHSRRLSLQKKLCGQASTIVPTSPRRARRGSAFANRTCSVSRSLSSFWTRREPPPR